MTEIYSARHVNLNHYGVCQLFLHPPTHTPTNRPNIIWFTQPIWSRRGCKVAHSINRANMFSVVQVLMLMGRFMGSFPVQIDYGRVQGNY